MIHINWNNFTLDSSLFGGLLIGLAIALLILINGRIAGISGIVSGLLTPSAENILWRVAFVIGIFISPICFGNILNLSAFSIDTSWILLIPAGFLVGLGARLGSGCTSGHGVCGISRLSRRSLLATTIFMIAGFVTTFVFRHFLI